MWVLRRERKVAVSVAVIGGRNERLDATEGEREHERGVQRAEVRHLLITVQDRRGTRICLLR